MIDYELAKELKEAGFPQKDFTPTGIESFANNGYDTAVTFPTLSELIEACGDRFTKLELDSEDKCWYADGITGGIFDGECSGDTPEEAVANLYIALNKK